MLVGIFNRLGNTADIELAICVKYRQVTIDQWKLQAGKSGLTDAEAFAEIVNVTAMGAENTVIDTVDLPPYDYYMAGATYDFIAVDWVYDYVLIGDNVTNVLVPTISNNMQIHIDAQAHALGYDNIESACTYASEPAVASFHDEGEAFRSWRSLVWEFCYTQLGAWAIGDAPITSNDLINDAGFPVLTLP
jgi:hypothetical protein